MSEMADVCTEGKGLYSTARDKISGIFNIENVAKSQKKKIDQEYSLIKDILFV